LPPPLLIRGRYDVFLRYQKQIHRDPVSRWPESAMKRFLCGGLDRSTKKTEKGMVQKLGSYHQCYRLDGKLVAVGVLDLLPHAVSSVYLFYDPEHRHHDWGKISALHEIGLSRENHYDYYYMGYYIHSCLKMRYKAGFRPSQLLDPETNEWNLFDDTYRQKLDKRKYVSPSRDAKESPLEDTVVAHTHDAVPQPAEESKNDSTKSRAAKFAEDEDLELDDEDSENDDAEIPEGSLFDYNVPGIMKKDEVAKLDLSHWKLVVRNSLIDLEVGAALAVDWSI
jgi:arginyl-tRNA---protein transferase